VKEENEIRKALVNHLHESAVYEADRPSRGQSRNACPCLGHVSSTAPSLPPNAKTTQELTHGKSPTVYRRAPLYSVQWWAHVIHPTALLARNLQVDTIPLVGFAP